jgi:hypothetical protein
MGRLFGWLESWCEGRKSQAECCLIATLRKNIFCLANVARDAPHGSDKYHGLDINHQRKYQRCDIQLTGA